MTPQKRSDRILSRADFPAGYEVVVIVRDTAREKNNAGMTSNADVHSLVDMLEDVLEAAKRVAARRG